MDKQVLTPEIIKRCNPGVNDFGIGSLMALASQCLRSAKKPTICDVCLHACPVDALVGENDKRPHPTTNCIKCGACVSICPVNALAGSQRTIQQINRLILQAALRVEHLAITCERTCGLLRLELETDAPERAEQELKLIDQAVSSEHLYKVPCLGMLSREIWFSALNEIGVARITELSIYLPPGQCDGCPANALGSIEEQFSEAIGVAESWTGHQIGLIMEASELPQARHSNVRAYLMGTEEVDRRGMFTGFVDELKATWEENSRVGNKALDEVQRQRARKQTFERTRLWAANKAPKKPGKQPITVPLRYALIEAIGRNPEHADDVVLMVSTTDLDLCTQCGDCIDACPVHTRRFVDIEPEPAVETVDQSTATEEPSAETTVPPAPEAAPESAPKAAPESAPEPERIMFADPLYCVGCTACLQVCPAQACGFDELIGSDFLL